MVFRVNRTALLALGWLGWLGCGAVYPEISTPLRAPPPGFALEPPPPRELVYVRFKDAVIPTKTRDGRKWEGGEAPDPYGKILLNGRDLVVTPVQSDTLRPTWPDQEPANYIIRKSDTVRVELWDSNPLTNHPICVENISELVRSVPSGEPELEVRCDNGGWIHLVVEPAHGKFGLGFSYEVGSGVASLTKVVRESPAGRAGLRGGDQILSVQGKQVSAMEEGALQSLINANASIGVTLEVKGPDARKKTATFKDGAVYPAADEGIPVP